MALRDTVVSAVDTAIAAIEDLAADIEYHAVTSPGSYNPATDGYTAAVETVLNFKGVKYNSRDESRDWQHADFIETFVLVSATSLGAHIASNMDWLVIDGVKYEVYRVDRLPGDPAFILVVRAV